VPTRGARHPAASVAGSATYIGRGKAERWPRRRAAGAAIMVFDDDLSGSQAKNLDDG